MTLTVGPGAPATSFRQTQEQALDAAWGLLNEVLTSTRSSHTERIAHAERVLSLIRLLDSLRQLPEAGR